MARTNHTCSLCGATGTWVDTTAGELIGPDGTVQGAAAPGELHLMVGREDGSDPEELYCGECARCITPGQQIHRLLRVYGITRADAARAMGISVSTLHGWLRPVSDPHHREAPERALRLLRYELDI